MSLSQNKRSENKASSLRRLKWKDHSLLLCELLFSSILMGRKALFLHKLRKVCSVVLLYKDGLIPELNKNSGYSILGGAGILWE